jgi:hypothetical protein
MKRRFIKSTFVAMVAAMFVTSCFNDSDSPDQQFQKSIGMQPTVLGRKLNNPFTVETMKKAYSNLKNGASRGRVNAEELDIRTTHLYVKFFPKDSIDVETLEKNDSLQLFDYPLDYEITIPGNFYHDPNTPLDQPTPKYTSVPVDFKFNPSISYQLLAELYLPNTDTVSALDGRINRNLFLEELEDEALRITGNLNENTTTANGRTQRSRYNPQGFIRVRNTFTGQLEGVPNVKARVRRWFEVRTAMTNNDGYYYISESFRHDVNYGVQFENNQAFIRPAWLGFGPAFIDGPNGGNTWNYNCEQGSDSYLWSVIMRGVFDYHFDYAQRFGIDPPPNWLKIRACSDNNCGVATMMHQNGAFMGAFGIWLFSDIRIGHRNESYREIYSTTIHELGHAAHWKLAGDWIIGNDYKMAWAHKLVREAWATAITDQVHIVKFGFAFYDGCRSRESMIDDGYLRVLGRDLIDNINEFIPGNTTCNVQDNVSGFTLSEIFYSLRGAHGSTTNNAMEKWRDNLANRRPAQRQSLIDYFNQFQK